MKEKLRPFVDFMVTIITIFASMVALYFLMLWLSNG